GVVPDLDVGLQVGVLGVDAGVDVGDADAAAVDPRELGVGAEPVEQDGVEGAVGHARDGARLELFHEEPPPGTLRRALPLACEEEKQAAHGSGLGRRINRLGRKMGFYWKYSRRLACRQVEPGRLWFS